MPSELPESPPVTEDGPIVAEGKYTEAELVQAHLQGIEPWWMRLLIVGFFVPITLAIVAWLGWFTDADPVLSSLLGPITLIVLAAFSIDLFWFGPRRRGRRVAQNTLTNHKLERIVFNDDWVIFRSDLVTGETSEAVVPWSRFKTVSISAQSALIVLSTRVRVSIPKRFFENDQQWVRFLRLVERRVGPIGSQTLHSDQYPTPTTDDATDSSAIHVSVTLRLDDIVEIFVSPHRRFRLWSAVVMTTISLVWTLAFTWIQSWDQNMVFTEFLWAPIAVGVTISLFWLLPLMIAWSASKRNSEWNQPFEASLRDSGLSIKSKEGCSRGLIAWPEFTRFRFTNRCLLLVLPNSSHIILPWRCFTNDALRDMARRLVYRNLGQCPNCQYPLRGTISDTCPECGRSLEPPHIWDPAGYAGRVSFWYG